MPFFLRILTLYQAETQPLFQGWLWSLKGIFVNMFNIFYSDIIKGLAYCGMNEHVVIQKQVR